MDNLCYFLFLLIYKQEGREYSVLFVHGVKQQNQRDCSVACLATVIKYFGGNISIFKLRKLIKIDNQGGTIFGILEASKVIGLESEALQGNLDELITELKLGNIQFPAIAHIITLEGISHFVVLTDFSEHSVEFFDPGFGNKKIPYHHFKQIWTGNLITFSKPTSFEIEKENKFKALKKYTSIFKQSYLTFIIITLISILLSLSAIVISYIYQFVIDKVILGNISNSDMSTSSFEKSLTNLVTNFPLLLTILLLFFGLQGIISIFRAFFISNLSKKMNDKLYYTFSKHLLKLDISFFYSRNTGEILSRYQTIMDIQQMGSKIILTIILEFFSLLAATIILIQINLNLFILACAMAIIYIVVTLIFVQPINELNKNKIEVNSSAVMTLSESLQGIETIKTEVLEKKYTMKFMQSIDKLTTYVKKEIQINNILMSLVVLVESIFMLLILFKGATYINSGSLTLGKLIAFLSLVPFFLLPIKNIMEIQPDIQKIMASTGKLNDILETPTENNALQLLPKNSYSDPILMLENVMYSYNFDKECLKDINIKIRKSEKIAIVGKSGSGKSTLLKILSSLITPEKGNFLVSQDLNISKKSEYRKIIGYIAQKSDIFSGTIKDNLLLNSNDKIMDKYKDDLDFIGFTNFINSCPLGLETQVIEQGSNFSSGQKQLIVLARLVISESKFLFLDEGTSHLDVLNEIKIVRYLTEHTKNMTVISIFHNINLVQYFEKIIVMDEGEIVGIGTHAELKKTNNIYKQLLNERV